MSQPREDKRRHPRFRDTVMITYEDVSDGHEPETLHELPCWLTEISEGGAMLQSPKPIAAGTTLVLHVNLPATDLREAYLQIRGTARWDREIAEGGPWCVGVQFESLSDADLTALKRYVEERFTSFTSIDLDNPPM